MGSCRHITKDLSESAYSWDRKGLERPRYLMTGIAWNRIKSNNTYITHTHTHTHKYTHTSTHRHAYIYIYIYQNIIP